MTRLASRPVRGDLLPSVDVRPAARSVEIHYVTVAPKKRVNHILHLLLSLITAGFWIPVWILCAISVGTQNSLAGSTPEQGAANKSYGRFLLGAIVLIFLLSQLAGA